eukprot:531826-Pelagomonas_calceolata.AAC.1
MLDSNRETLREVLKADLYLDDRDESCWFAHVSKAFSGMHNEEMFKQRMLSASNLKISMQEFIVDLSYCQQKVWREADVLSRREMNRKAVKEKTMQTVETLPTSIKEKEIHWLKEP